jgi:hypothetical protein
MDRPQKLAEIDAKEVLNKIDFNLSKDISYSGKLAFIQNFWWLQPTSKESSPTRIYKGPSR